MSRQIVLDTETTGLDVNQGHRIIEVGCVEMVNRRSTGKTFHQYINPERVIDAGAQDVHGLSNDFLDDKPLFADIADEFLTFVAGAELIIHNAPFDVGFINQELVLAKIKATVEQRCRILDTLSLARSMHPGQRNNLDALCKRYGVDNSGRELHGALLDAQILAEVYLLMTGGQAALSLDSGQADAAGDSRKGTAPGRRIDRAGLTLVVRRADPEDLAAHEALLDAIEQEAGRASVWRGKNGVS